MRDCEKSISPFMARVVMALTAETRPMERASSSMTSWSMRVESMSKTASLKRGHGVWKVIGRRVREWGRKSTIISHEMTRSRPVN